jgi:hypothetical protein
VVQSLQVFNAQLDRGIFPCGVELLFNQRRFVIAFLRHQALPQAEEQPTVARALLNRPAEDSFCLFSPSVTQQRDGQRLPYRVEPRGRLVVLDSGLDFDRAAPLLDRFFRICPKALIA